jgi:hypothetical protein
MLDLVGKISGLPLLKRLLGKLYGLRIPSGGEMG